MKRQTEKLLEVDQFTMLLALQTQLDNEVTGLKDVLKLALEDIDRVNAVKLGNELMGSIADSIVSIQELKEAILEIARNDPELPKDVVIDLNDVMANTFAPDDIPF